MLPDDGGDEEDLAVAGQQQGPEEEAELRGLPHRQPQEAHRSAAEGQELCVGNPHTSGTNDEIIFPSASYSRGYDISNETKRLF